MILNARPPTTFIGKKLRRERFRDSALPYTAVAVIFIVSKIFGLILDSLGWILDVFILILAIFVLILADYDQFFTAFVSRI